MIDMFGISDVGCVRENNEDRFCVDEQLGLCLVADGMGGHGHGEVAAGLAVEVSHHFMVASKDRFDVTWPFGYDYDRTLDENRLMNAIQLANRQIWNTVLERPECAGMGSTLIAITVDDGRCVIGGVGDSRVYLLRDGEMRQMSVDDSWVGDLVRSGSLTEQAARLHSMRNVLTQAVGAQHDLNVHTCEQPLEDGDALLLATDGVYGVVETATIRSILYSYQDVKAAAEQLVRAAREAGAPDNATCIVLRYRSKEGI
jgi:serine/threonine protein phosphatase PrpC